MKHLSLLLISALLVACSGGIDPVEPPSELSAYSAELKLQPRWSRTVGSGSGGKYLKLVPLLDGERLVVADRYGEVRAYHSLSGELIWQTELERVISAGVGAGGELLLFGGDAEVFALDGRSGELRWRTPIGSEVLSAPVTDGEKVVLHAVDGSIIALSLGDGTLLWRHLEEVPSLSLRGSSRPLIVDGVVHVGTAGGEVVALRLEDGRPLWRATVAAPRGRTDLDRMVDVDAEMAEADGVLYAVAFQGRVAAIQRANGQLLWSREFSSPSGIVIDAEHLFLSDEAGDVWALSRRNGATLWKQAALHRRALSMPAQQGRYLVLGDYDGYLHWLDKEDGHIVARTRVRDWQEHFPVEDTFDPIPYHEDRQLLVAPLVEGTRVYGFDQRGVLDAYEVSVLEQSE